MSGRWVLRFDQFAGDKAGYTRIGDCTVWPLSAGQGFGNLLGVVPMLKQDRYEDAGVLNLKLKGRSGFEASGVENLTRSSVFFGVVAHGQVDRVAVWRLEAPRLGQAALGQNPRRFGVFVARKSRRPGGRRRSLP